MPRLDTSEIRDRLHTARGTIALAAELQKEGITDHKLLSLALGDLRRAEQMLNTLRPRFAGGASASQSAAPVAMPQQTTPPSESISGPRIQLAGSGLKSEI